MMSTAYSQTESANTFDHTIPVGKVKKTRPFCQKAFNKV